MTNHTQERRGESCIRPNDQGDHEDRPYIKSTTIIAVMRDGKIAFAGDGQASLGNTIMKANVKKIREIRDGTVLAGFAGSTADAFTLFEKFEAKLEQYNGKLTRAAVELAKDWRTDKYLRRLEALLIVADKEKILTISGNGDVIEPDDGIAVIGSGGMYALAAARSLVRHTKLPAAKIAEESLKAAAEICVFTNDHITLKEIA